MLLALLSVIAASGGAAHAFGYIAAVVLVLIVLPMWLIRRGRNHRR